MQHEQALRVKTQETVMAAAKHLYYNTLRILHHGHLIIAPRPLRPAGAGAPRNTPLIATSHLQPLLHAQFQLALQVLARLLAVDEITEPAAHAPFARVESTARLTKIRHGTQLAVYRSRRIPPRIQRVARRLRIFFVFEARIHISNKIYQNQQLASASQPSLPPPFRPSFLWGETHDHCYCRKQPPLRPRRTCTSRKRSLRRTRRNGSAAATGSSCFWDRTRGSGTGSAAGSFASTTA